VGRAGVGVRGRGGGVARSAFGTLLSLMGFGAAGRGTGGGGVGGCGGGSVGVARRFTTYLGRVDLYWPASSSFPHATCLRYDLGSIVLA